MKVDVCRQTKFPRKMWYISLSLVELISYLVGRILDLDHGCGVPSGWVTLDVRRRQPVVKLVELPPIRPLERLSH